MKSIFVRLIPQKASSVTILAITGTIGPGIVHEVIAYSDLAILARVRGLDLGSKSI